MSARPDIASLEPDLRDVLLRVCALLREAGGRAWLVGGTVRDLAAGLPARDLDVEVFGLSGERVQDVLAAEFPLDLVGRSFGVIKLKDVPLDVGLARRETKLGEGHRAFAVETGADIALPEAAARRDFTMNAVYLDPLTGVLEDPFGGLDDLRRGVLRHTSPAFVEDPLRVLRAMQLAARFDLETAPETVRLCRTVGLEGLPRERIFEEWRKLILMGRRPSRGLALLADTGWLRHFPELDALRGVPQDPEHHPEGDVWVHTGHCLDAFADERLGVPWEDLVVGLAVLCHDLGKPETTLRKADGRWRALGHEQAGLETTRSFLARITGQRRLVTEVLPLVAEHMRPKQLFQQRSGDGAVRRLAVRVDRIDRLVRVARADNFGRPPLPADEFPAGDWLLARAADLDVAMSAPRPLVFGRHLRTLGARPGPVFGRILDACYRAQLDGEIATEDEGIALAGRLLEQKQLRS